MQKAGFILGPKRQPRSEEVEESRVSRAGELGDTLKVSTAFVEGTGKTFYCIQAIAREKPDTRYQLSLSGNMGCRHLE